MYELHKCLTTLGYYTNMDLTRQYKVILLYPNGIYELHEQYNEEWNSEGGPHVSDEDGVKIDGRVFILYTDIPFFGKDGDVNPYGTNLYPYFAISRTPIKGPIVLPGRIRPGSAPVACNDEFWN